MKKPGLSVGSIVMMLVTAFVVVGMAAFLSLIAGDDVYERTRAVFGNLAEQTAERETAEPTVSPTKTPFFEATAEPTAEPTPTATPDQSPKTITIAAAGTIYAPKAVRESAQEGMDHYDFTTTFEGLSGALAGADLSVVTLETTLAGREKGYGNYNTSPQLLDALRAVGVNFVSLATERALDKGYDGLDITASELTSRSMGYAGVYPDGVNTGAAMLNVGGVQVAVLAYAYGLSDEGRERTKGDSRGVVALMETQRVTRDIAQARVDGANIVVVLPHWGTKNRAQTPDTVHAMAERMAQAGADVIGAVFVPLGQQVILVPQRRARADDCHIAHKDVPELGQLVQTGLAQEVSHPGDILIRVLEHVGGHIVGGVDAHGAELEDIEMLFVDAHPLLPEKDRSRGIDLDGKAEDEQQRREHDHAAEGQNDRQQPLDAVSIHGRSSVCNPFRAVSRPRGSGRRNRSIGCCADHKTPVLLHYLSCFLSCSGTISAVSLQ